MRDRYLHTDLSYLAMHSQDATAMHQLCSISALRRIALVEITRGINSERFMSGRIKADDTF